MDFTIQRSPHGRWVYPSDSALTVGQVAVIWGSDEFIDA